MRAQPRVDLVLEGLVALVAVCYLQSAEKFFTVLLAAEFGDERPAPRVSYLGEIDLSPGQAGFDLSIRPSVGQQRGLADA